MKKNFAALLVCLALAATSPDADAARRFGGGSNLGSRPVPTFTQKAPASGSAASPGARQTQGTSAQTQQNRARQTQQTPAQKPSMARSLLTGLAAALGISALLSLFGIHGAGAVSLVTGLLLAALLFLGFRCVLRQRTVSRSSGRTEHASGSWSEPPREEPRAQQGSPRDYGRASSGRSVMDEMMDDAAPQEASPEDRWEDVTPADFDRQAFLRVARENYIALQKAWDTGNVIGISDFTTEDVFIAVTHQLKARGNEVYKTEIVEVKDELLGIAREGREYLASVRFTGKLIINGEAETVDETWVLVKPVEGPGGWLLGAIKQNSPEA